MYGYFSFLAQNETRVMPWFPNSEPHLPVLNDTHQRTGGANIKSLGDIGQKLLLDSESTFADARAPIN